MASFDLGLPNKYISYSIVNWLNYLIIPLSAASLQSKSFYLNIDYVPIFSLITPITLAIIYYLIRNSLFPADKDAPKSMLIIDIFIAFSLLVCFYIFLYFIVLFRENISQLSVINYFLQFNISSNTFILLTIILLLITLWLVGVKIIRIISYFIVFCFILEGFLFLLVINAIYQINAEPLDFLNSFSTVIFVYLLIWTGVSIYAACLDLRKKGEKIRDIPYILLYKS